MSTRLLLQPLTESNFSDYERLTRAELNGKSGCYCAFWHQKWASMEEWVCKQKEAPLENRDIVQSRMRSGFHVGVLAYSGNELVAWISIGPLPEFYWTWKRVAKLGEAAQSTAGILCINIEPGHRGKGCQESLLNLLVPYGRARGWSTIEGYPFDEDAYKKHGEKVAWPGTPRAFQHAGFKAIGPHWLNSGEYPRSIYKLEIAP